MNQEQYANLMGPTEQKPYRRVKFDMDSLGLPRAARTLLYGYDCDRDTFHLYVEPVTGHVILAIYGSEDRDGTRFQQITNVTTEGVGSLQNLIPNKRLYPQYCDYDFCLYLKAQGCYMSFTTWQERDDRGWFAGEVVVPTKSQIAREAAEKLGLPVIEVKLSMFDAKDFVGLPISEE